MKKGHYLFTSESVSQGHPDKVADQISDNLVDYFIAHDKNSHCAIETMCTTGQVIVAGEVKSEAYVDIPTVVRDTINKIGYTKSEYQFDGNSCGVLSAIHEQSPDIDMGVSRNDVENQGAGDQGMMFGYATNETDNYMPVTLELAHMIVKELAEIREEIEAKSKDSIINVRHEMYYLRPDAKSQVTVEYDENDKPVRIDTIVVSTQHDEFGTLDEMQTRIKNDVINIVIPRVIAKCSDSVKNLFDDNIKYFVNPTGNFIIGGPCSDTGVTGRKIIVDTYGGWGAHGGGAFSGKDSSKVDRSVAYMTRYIAKNCVAAGIADRMLIQISYAIGIAEPVSFYVNTYGTNHTNYTDSEIGEKLAKLFDCRPYYIAKTLKLHQPMYAETAAYGHFGRKNEIVHKRFESKYSEPIEMDVELFTWEKLDNVDMLKKEFGL